MTSFEFDGHKYKQVSKHQREWGDKILSEFNFQGNELILDLGCGDGGLTNKLSDFVPNGEVIGIDASKGMIGEAKKLKKENLVFILEDIDDIDYENRFDLIFSNAALHWIKNHEKLLKNCYRALKPEGIIRFNFAGYGNCSNFFMIVKEVMKYQQFKTYFDKFEWPWYMPKIDEYRGLVGKSSFSEIRVWGEDADRYFSSEDEMVGWIDQPSIVPFLKSISDEKDRKEFRDIVVEKTVGKTKQADGTCFETFRRINVYARKSYSTVNSL